MSSNLHFENQRSHKGKSVILLSDTYIVIDIETTGLSVIYDEIIEISALKVKDGAVIDSFSSLVNLSNRYGSLSDMIIQLTGITNEMLSTAPSLEEVIPKFKHFVGNELLIGHNVSFDINFLYDACMEILNEPLSNDFVNTMRFSKKLFPELQHHRLSDIAEKLNIIPEGKHRALVDCETTNNCYTSMSQIIKNKYGDINDFYNLFKKKHHKGIDINSMSAETNEFDETHPLYNKVCIFTGTLDRMPRKEAMQLVLNYGGKIGNNITQQTNYLILGCNDFCKSIKDGKSSKHKKAEEYKLKGYDIEIIDEDVFYSMLEE